MAERVDLTGLVEEVALRLAATAMSHRIQVVDAEPAIVQGDRERLEQVIANLIDNAIKFSPRGGPSQGRIDVTIKAREQEVVVSVTDHGIGIPKEKQGQVFQRFYRAHTGTNYDYGGMGVGLYISKEIITRLGGRMWFESEPGKGSTFYFSLPLDEG